MTGQGQSGGVADVYPKKFPALSHGDLDGTHSIDIDLNRFRSHVTKFRLTGNLTITISNPPLITEGILFFVEITQDGVGGRTITWPAAVIGNPQPAAAANSKTLIMLFTTDKGVTYHSQIIGVTGGGGGAGEVFTWSANHSANQFSLVDLNKIQFKSTLNFLQITREGTAPGYDTMGFEAPAELDFFINRSFNPIPRFSILQNLIKSNVDLDMSDKVIENIQRLEFGASGNEGTIDSTSAGMRITANTNERIELRTGGSTRLEIDDLTDDLIISNLDVIIGNGRSFNVQDTVPTRSLQVFHIFGEQYINASNVLNIQVGLTDRVKIDSRFRLAAGIDLDLTDNDIANIKTAQIKELFPAGTAPAGITDTAILFCRPSGAGKTEFRVKFQTGNSVLIAEEP